MVGWQKTEKIKSRRFACGFCSAVVASDTGYVSTNAHPLRSSSSLVVRSSIYICAGCGQPNYFDEKGFQAPSPTPGRAVEHVPQGLGELYLEARRCCSIGAHTSAVLACRKMLMNISVQHGAEPGKAFAFYVEFLSAQGFVPPNGKGWVDHIRKKGNEATHEIALMSASDAEELLGFVEMLLKFIFEFPGRLPSAAAS